jgi:hypothetical protein
MKKQIPISLIVIFSLIAAYILIIGFPESNQWGEVKTCHGIPLQNSICLGYKSTFAYIDLGPTASPASQNIPIPNITISKESVLLVSGILHKDGQVDWSDFYRLPVGVIDSPLPGDHEYSLKVLDLSGNLLHETLFSATFKMMYDSSHGVGSQDVDSVPFGYAVPFPREAQVIQLVQQDKLLATSYIATRLLGDGINTIPSAAYKNDAFTAKQKLGQEVNFFDESLSRRDLKSGVTTLYEIRKFLQENLVDDYKVDSVLQYSKPAILELIDELMVRVGS